MIFTKRKRKPLYGVGINDSTYDTKSCPFYKRWKDILTRCYSSKFLERRPSNKGVVVCQEWLTFSTFKKWMQEQEWEGNFLDKDILGKGLKIYSPSTCIFIPQILNSFIQNNSSTKRTYLKGCYFCKRSKHFCSSTSNPFTGKNVKVRGFSTEIDAHMDYKKRRLEYLNKLKEDLGFSEEIYTGMKSLL